MFNWLIRFLTWADYEISDFWEYTILRKPKPTLKEIIDDMIKVSVISAVGNTVLSTISNMDKQNLKENGKKEK